MRKIEKDDYIVLIADEGKVLSSDSFQEVKVVNVPDSLDIKNIVETEETAE